MEYILLEELSRILREGVPDLNEAAKRLGLPLSVVQGAFADGLLKGYWKVADGKLLMHSSPDEHHQASPRIVARGAVPRARLPHNGDFTPSPPCPFNSSAYFTVAR